MQPQNQGPAFNAGSTPSPGVYLDATTVAPETDCAGAMSAALGHRAGLEAAASYGNNSQPGTYTAAGGVDSAGSTQDL